MATQIVGGSGIGFWFGPYSVCGDFNAVSLDHSADILEDTTLCDDSRSRVAGLKNTTLAGEGYIDTADGGVDDIMYNQIHGSKWPLTVAPVATTVGSLAYFFDCLTGMYSPSGSIGELFGFSVTGESTSPLVRGQVEYNDTATFSVDSTGFQLGALSAGQTLYAAIHVLSVSGTSPTLDVIVQSDDNSGFTSTTDQITFTQATGVTSQILSVDGAVTDDYWRFRLNIGGTSPSFNVVCVFGII